MHRTIPALLAFSLLFPFALAGRAQDAELAIAPILSDLPPVIQPVGGNSSPRAGRETARARHV